MRTLVLLAIACTGLAARGVIVTETGDWNWRGSVAKGRSVEIRGITGDIRAIPATGGEVEIAAIFHRIQGRDGIEIRVAEGAAGVTVCAVRKGADTCATDPMAGPGVRIDYRVRVPKGVNLIARTVNGRIHAESLSSDVDVSTVNGPVVISTSGTAHARTVNGSIRAYLLKAFWRKSPEFSAVNGGIFVNLPTNARAAVHAETKNGKILTEVCGFRGISTEQSLNGTIGGGGAANALVLRTVNGAIELTQNF